MGFFALIVLGVIVVVVLIGLSSAIRIINEYERGVLFRLGRLMALKGPGLRLIIPFGIDRLVKIDLRTVTLEVPPQEVISLDNVTIKVNAVIYFLVVNPNFAVTKVANYHQRHVTDSANNTAERARPVVAGRVAGEPREDQWPAAADYRRADRAVGHQGVNG